MSLTMRKNQAQAEASARWDRARSAAIQAAPLARNAGATAAQDIQVARDWAAPRLAQGFYVVRDRGVPRLVQGVYGARDWTAPRLAQGVYVARAWSAPRIDQAGHALEESVAPKVSQALTATARRVQPAVVARRRRWPRLIGALLAATVIGGVIAAVLRGRSARVNDTVLLDEDLTAQAGEPETMAGEEPAMTDAGIAGNGKEAAH